MQLDGALIALSLLGLALAPLWAWAWSRAMLKRALPRLTRALSVVALSLLTLFMVGIGPLLMLAGNHGLLGGEAADPSVVVTFALFCFIGIVIQVIAALAFALAEPRPNSGAINQLK